MSDDTNKPAKPFNLNMHTARLLMREPFFAALSRRIDKTSSTSYPDRWRACQPAYCSV